MPREISDRISRRISKTNPGEFEFDFLKESLEEVLKESKETFMTEYLEIFLEEFSDLLLKKVPKKLCKSLVCGMYIKIPTGISNGIHGEISRNLVIHARYPLLNLWGNSRETPKAIHKENILNAWRFF